MSEPRRVSLQPAVDRLAERVGDPAGGGLGGCGGVASKLAASQKKKKRLTMRFNLDLGNPNEDVCHEFNYIELVRNHKRVKSEPPEGDDPFEESDEDEVAAIARKMEEKYGTGKVAWDDDVDRGQGYDEDDSFIDNGEAYDEVVPLDLNTKHGGFYINSGELEFVPASPLQYAQYHQQNEANRNKVTLEDSPPEEDSDQESERAPSPKEEKQQSPLKVKRRRKRKRLYSDDSKDNRDQGSGEKERDDRRQKRKEKMLIKKIKRIESSSDEDADGDKSADEAGQTDREKAIKEEPRDNVNRVDRDKDKEMKDKLLDRMSVKQERQLDDAIESVVRKAREENKKEVEEEEMELLRQQEEQMEREERQKERRQNKERLERADKERLQQQQQLQQPTVQSKDKDSREHKERQLLVPREKDNNRETRERLQVHQKDREVDRDREQQRVVALQQQLPSQQQQQQQQQQVSSQQQLQQQRTADPLRERGADGRDSREKERLMMLEQKMDYSGSAANEFTPHRLPDAAVRLPDRMPRELERMIADITAVARVNLGKSKFFQANGVNETLLQIDRVARQSLPCSQRTQLYAYLTAHLPCSKETLLKRIKKLRLDEEDMKVKEPMARFRAELDHMVKEQVGIYRRGCDEIGQKPCSTDSEGEDGDARVHRVFEWTDALRRLFREVVSLKLKTYEVSKLRATSAEDYVRNFFEIDMISLWPRGWMNVRTLLRMAREEQLFQRARSDSLGSGPRKLTQLQNFGAGANGTPMGGMDSPTGPQTPTTPLGAVRGNSSYSSIETPLKESYKDAMQLDVTPSSRTTTPGNTSVIREKGASGANSRTPEDPPGGQRSHPLTPGVGINVSTVSREHRDLGHSVLSVISDSPSVLVKEERVPSPVASPPASSAISDRYSPLGGTPSSTPLAATTTPHSDTSTTPVHMSVITSSPAKQQQQQPPLTSSQLLPQVETPSFGDSFAPLMLSSHATSASGPLVSATAAAAAAVTAGANSTNSASSMTVQTPPPKKQHSATPLLKANYQAALQKSPPFGSSGVALANTSAGSGVPASAVTSPSAAQTFAQFSQKVAAAAAAAAAVASNTSAISYSSSAVAPVVTAGGGSGATPLKSSQSPVVASPGSSHSVAASNSNSSGQYHQSKSVAANYQQQHKYQQQTSSNQQQQSPHQGVNNSHYGGSSSHNNYYVGSTGQPGAQQHSSNSSSSSGGLVGGGSHNNHTGGANANSATHTSNSGHHSASSRDKDPLMASQSVLDRIITQQLATNSYPSGGGSASHLSSPAGGSVSAAVFAGSGGAGVGGAYPATTSGGNSIGSYPLGGSSSLMSPPSHRSSHQSQQHKSPQLPRGQMPSPYNIYEALQQPQLKTTAGASASSNAGGGGGGGGSGSRNSSNSGGGVTHSSQQQGMMMQQATNQQPQRSSSNLDGMKGFSSPMTSHSQTTPAASNIPSYYTSTTAAAAAGTSPYHSSTHQQPAPQQTTQQQQLQRQSALASSVAHSSPTASQTNRYSWGTQAMYSTQQQQQQQHQQRHMYQDQQQEKILYQQYSSAQGQDSTSQLRHNRQTH